MAAGNSINESTTGITGFTGTAFVGTPVTNHGIVLGGSTSSTLGNVGPDAATGKVLQSQGSSADPAFSTATYPATAGTSGNVITSNGTNFVSSALPAASYDPPIGSLQYFANAAGDAYLGSNWLKCNGASVSQATYATLYARLGLITDVQNATMTSVTNLPATTNSIAFGNNLFVAVGNTGAISTSTDLVTWTTRTSGTASNLSAVIYGNNIYVTGGTGGVLLTSTDGITWTSQTYGAATNLTCLGYGNNVYLAAGTATMRSSTDAVTWGAVTSNLVTPVSSINYGNNKYVWTSGSATSAIGYSTDAVTWTALVTQAGNGIANAKFINGLFVTLSTQVNLGEGTEIFYSSDGINWLISYTSFALIAPSNNRSMFNTGSKIYAIFRSSITGEGPYIGTSTDGINYRMYSNDELTSTTAAIGNYTAIAASNTNLLVVNSGGSFNKYAALYSYNTATNFLLPTENNSGILGTQPVPYNLYIKAL